MYSIIVPSGEMDSCEEEILWGQHVLCNENKEWDWKDEEGAQFGR